MDEQVIVDYKALGARIKQKRLSLGLTQEKLAEQLNIDESYYSRIERGDRVLSIVTLLKLANFYEVSVDWLLLDSSLCSAGDKLLVELDNIFRGKSPSQAAFLLNLLKIQAENIDRLHT